MQSLYQLENEFSADDFSLDAFESNGIYEEEIDLFDEFDSADWDAIMSDGVIIP